MEGLTDYITECPWGDILITLFVLVDDTCQELDMCFVPNRKYAPLGSPAFSDSEVITIALFGEMVFSGAEDKTLHFIRQYHLDMFPQLLDSSRFNRRKRRSAIPNIAIRTRKGPLGNCSLWRHRRREGI